MPYASFTLYSRMQNFDSEEKRRATELRSEVIERKPAKNTPFPPSVKSPVTFGFFSETAFDIISAMHALPLLFACMIFFYLTRRFLAA